MILSTRCCGRLYIYKFFFLACLRITKYLRGIEYSSEYIYIYICMHVCVYVHTHITLTVVGKTNMGGGTGLPTLLSDCYPFEQQVVADAK